MKPVVLVVDDEPDVRLALGLYLRRAGFSVEEAGSLAEARDTLTASRVDGVLLDLNLPDGSGLGWIEELRDAKPGAAIVVMTGRGDIPTAVQAMRLGADHFLTKPLAMQELEVFLRKSLEVGGLRRRSRAESRHGRPAEPFLGGGPAARRLLEEARRAAQNDAPVLLQGETGCGKGVLARFIHDVGPRASCPFVELNCAGLRPELLASELFGHARGAFTSADRDKPGLLDLADGGTLFLDEIGEMELQLQSRFLKVLEEKRYRPLGDVRERRSEFRLICASNRELQAEVAAKRFRSDLYYRVAVLPIRIEPLRERHEDIPALAEHLLAGLGRGDAKLAPEAVALLRRYEWPGNVRELRNALERARLLSSAPVLAAADFAWLTPAAVASSPRPDDPDLAQIRAAIAEHGGDVAGAARALGMSRATLYRRLRQARG